MSATKSEVKRLVADLRRVTKWGRMAIFAAANGLPVTRTWDPFLERLLEDNTSEAALRKVADKLTSFYVAQLSAGDRIVMFFRPSVDFGARLYNLAKRPVQKGCSIRLKMFQQTSEQPSLRNAS